jgi:hypothetical protein
MVCANGRYLMNAIDPSLTPLKGLSSLTFNGSIGAWYQWEEGDVVTIDTTMTEADFSGKKLGAVGAQILAAFMGTKLFQDQAALSKLDISSNSISSTQEQCIKQLCAAKNITLRTQTGIEPGVYIISLVDGEQEELQIQAHRSDRRDCRNHQSTYPILRSVHGSTRNNFRFDPVGAEDGVFTITLVADEVQHGGVDQRGWQLQAHRSAPADKRDSNCTFPVLHKIHLENRNKWLCKPASDQKGIYTIALAADEVKHGGVDQTGWKLGVDKKARGAQDMRSRASSVNSYLAMFSKSLEAEAAALSTWLLTPAAAATDSPVFE